MKQGLFTVTENACLAKDIWRMRLRGDTSAVTAPGQFVNLKLEGFFLRRPISVCDVEGDVLTLIYKPLGQGTRLMTSFLPGKKLDVLSGLGNGFDPALSGEKPLLVGGGVGIPPLYLLCRRLVQRGVQPAVILGFNTREEVFLETEFRALGASVTVLTADGPGGSGKDDINNCLVNVTVTAERLSVSAKKRDGTTIDAFDVLPDGTCVDHNNDTLEVKRQPANYR